MAILPVIIHAQQTTTVRHPLPREIQRMLVEVKIVKMHHQPHSTFLHLQHFLGVLGCYQQQSIVLKILVC